MLFVFDIIILLLLYIDIRLYKRIITPFSVFASVYLVLINLNNLIVTHIYGFYLVSNQTLCILGAFLILIFGVDILGAKVLYKLKDRELLLQEPQKLEKFISVLYLLGCAAMSYQFVELLQQYGIHDMKGRAAGPLAHVSKICLIFTPLFLDLAFRSKNKLRICLSCGVAAVVLVLMLIKGGKYHIVIQLLYIVFYFLMSRQKKISLKKLMLLGSLVVLGAFCIFIAIYFVVPILTNALDRFRNPLSAFAFSVRTFFGNLVGPVVANNFTLANPGAADPWIPFTVPVNILKALLGSRPYVNPIFEHVIYTRPGSLINVSGIVGETVYCLGFVYAALYLIAIFAVINVFYILYRKYDLYKMTCAYALCLIFLGFFANFFTTSGALLPLIYLFILETGLQAYPYITAKRRKAK